MGGGPDFFRHHDCPEFPGNPDPRRVEFPVERSNSEKRVIRKFRPHLKKSYKNNIKSNENQIKSCKNDIKSYKTI